MQEACVMEGIENLGKRLRELREQRELTMDMVVYDINQKYNIMLTKGNLSRWENGINYPSLLSAAFLAKYYNVSVDYLIGNTQVKTPVDLLVVKRKQDDNFDEQMQELLKQKAEVEKKIEELEKEE